MHTNSVEFVLWQALAIFLLVWALLGILVGLLLILNPRLMQSINRVANRWISTRRMNQLLDRSISIEHWFYRHHRAVGMIAAAGAIYIFVYFGLLFDKATAIRRLSDSAMAGVVGGLFDALVLSSLICAAVAFMVGLFLWLRPSMLRDIEAEANRWVSLRRATKALDVPRDQVDRFVARHSRRVGWLLLLGSLYLFLVLVNLLA
jgi:hypothetical protein